MRRVGIVGIGGMGGGLADRLIDEGWEVVLWNRSSGALDRFAGRAGATLAGSPAEAAATGCVLSFVANDAALEAVTTGSGGILEGLAADGVHVSMSSVSPSLVERLAQLHSDRLVGAPVFGRPEAAAKGLLWVAISGPETAKARSRAVLQAVSRSIHEFGEDPAAAPKVKIAGNFVIASAIEAMAEAFALLERSGADPRAFHAMMAETIFGSVIHQNYGRIILDRTFEPPGFRLALGGKDIGLARDMAAAAGLSLPFADILAGRFAAAMENGRGEQDWNAIAIEAQDA